MGEGEEQRNVRGEENKNKNKGNPCAHGYFCQSRKNSSSLSFLSILGKKHFDEPGEKTLEPHHLFSFLPTQPNTLQKSFPSHFLFKVFHPPYFNSKQTHPKETQRGANQIHSKKVFLLIFSPKFFIHLISPPNKHALKLG